MKLTKITITNFKGLASAEFDLTNFACLVGENNAGKSSILQAIVFSLNRPPQLPIELHYDADSPIIFSLDFDGVTADHLNRLVEEHRAKIADLVSDETLKLFIKYPPGQKCEVTTQKRIPRNLQYRQEAIKGALSGKRGAAVRNAVLAEYPEFAAELPEAVNISQATEYINACIRELPEDNFEFAEGPLPSGISSSISALLPEPIYIPAVKNLGDDLKTTQTTPFGRLLGLLLEDMNPELDAINNSLLTLESMLNRVNQEGVVVDNRHDKVRELEAAVETFLSQNFPRVKLELHVPPPELKTILNSAQIFVDDGSRDLIENKGDGIKRSLTFALLQTYVHNQSARRSVDSEARPAQRPLLFLFEEPELYLHPKSQRVLFNTLARISETYQVVVTTHSPIFFAPGVTAAFVRVAKSEVQPKPVGKLYPVNFSLDQASAEVFKLARFDNADAAFFSRRVVLFEGESDDAYCKHIAPLLNGEWNFDQKSIALVRVSGKGNFPRYRKFFEAFGIDVKIVADLDAIFEGHQHLGCDASVIAARATAIQVIDRRIQETGISAEPSPRQIKDKVNGESWRNRYDTAKTALRTIQEKRTVDAQTVELLDGLFTWEKDIARVRACKDDALSLQALLPALDRLRQQGVCVLARGAIEDYYPPGAPTNGPKPDRALAAIKLIETDIAVRELSEPLAPGRSPELFEIFEELFRDLP
ncbi:MAG: AAA family ATPase [Candidatus Pacebacteria bacterium]|nr:AAA family ATPase [Candidatus Paceibacterota bacterium]